MVTDILKTISGTYQQGKSVQATKTQQNHLCLNGASQDLLRTQPTRPDGLSAKTDQNNHGGSTVHHSVRILPVIAVVHCPLR